MPEDKSRTPQTLRHFPADFAVKIFPPGMWTLANPRIQAALICLVIAFVYVFIWPGRKNPERLQQMSVWSRIVLRWFHSLTWMLIALACLLWSKLPALAAGAVYIVFIITTMQARNLSGRR